MNIPASFFSTDIFWSGLKWLMLFSVWGLFALGTWREDSKIKSLLKDMQERNAARILRILHRRDMQIWLQVSLLLVVMAANDLHRAIAQLPPGYFAAPAPAAPPPPAPAPVAAKESPDDQYEKVLQKTRALNLPFSNITEFNEQNSKREAYIDWLKQHYESWLITYYYLEKCKKTKPEDYGFIHDALTRDLTAAHAGAEVEGNILLAATGSYKEMYSDISCADEHLATTKSLYDANMQQARQAQKATPSAPHPAKPE